MERLTFTPEPLIEARCVICGKYLSVAPILSSPNGKIYKCGRCTKIHKKSVNTRLTILENVAKYFTFPCIYPNCNKQIQFENIKEHERICDKRTIICPIENCDDTVMVEDITPHFETKHNPSIYYEEFNATPLKIYTSYVFLLVQENSPFFIYLRLGHKNSWVGIFSLAQPFNSDLKFNINVTGKKGARLLIDKQKVQSFDEQEHCYKCIIRRCMVKYHKNSCLYTNGVASDNVMTPFSSEYMEKLCDSGTLLYSIEVYVDRDVHLQEASSSRLAYNSNVLRQYLECPVCKLYMTSPILICQRGHVICRPCMQRCQSCPTCRAHFTNSRIYALENIADRIELLCQNEVNGCKFIGKSKMIEEHEVNCIFSRLKKPLGQS